MKTIFIKLLSSPTVNKIKALDSIAVNVDEKIKSDFIFFNEQHFDTNLKYCNLHNLNSNYKSLINKYTSYSIYNKYGFSTLPTIKPLQLLDIENYQSEKFFLKPVIGMGSNGFFLKEQNRRLISQAYYTPIAKQSVLDILSIEGSNFWDAQQTEHDGIIIQKYVNVYDNSQINFYVQYGCINGQGNIFFCNPAIGTKTRINGEHRSTMTYSPENMSNEILNIQSKIQDMVLGENIKNCLFNMQFMCVDNEYKPIDFNPRLGYQDIYICDQFPELGWGKSLIEYAYDITDTVPSRPQLSTAQLLIGKRAFLKKIAHGQTKQEALDNLELLINN